MRRFSYLASVVGLFVVGVPLGVHLLRSESAFKNHPSITAASSLGKPETCLRLGFAARSGLYLSNVRVAIRDFDGDLVIDLISDGPWLQVPLAPGTYHVAANFDGTVHELRNVRLSDGDSVTHVLYWDLNIVPIELLAQVYGLKIVLNPWSHAATQMLTA